MEWFEKEIVIYLLEDGNNWWCDWLVWIIDVGVGKGEFKGLDDCYIN